MNICQKERIFFFAHAITILSLFTYSVCDEKVKMRLIVPHSPLNTIRVTILTLRELVTRKPLQLWNVSNFTDINKGPLFRLLSKLQNFVGIYFAQCQKWTSAVKTPLHSIRKNLRYPLCLPYLTLLIPEYWCKILRTLVSEICDISVFFPVSPHLPNDRDVRRLQEIINLNKIF